MQQTDLIDIAIESVSKSLRIKENKVRSILERDNLVNQYTNNGKLDIYGLAKALAATVISQSNRAKSLVLISPIPLCKKVRIIYTILAAEFPLFALFPLRLYERIRNHIGGVPTILVLFGILFPLPVYLSSFHHDILAFIAIISSTWIWLCCIVLIKSYIFGGRAGKGFAIVERQRDETTLWGKVEPILACLLVVNNCFAAWYTVLQSSSSAAFHHFHPCNMGDYPFFNFQYFGIATMATVGYGDIYPVSWAAKLLTEFQIFHGIVILIVCLSYAVSLHKDPNP